ncbi:MAG: periplasmic heavy metal sensor [Tabrizicola sp.]|nr:periplasmic heavy metal sensor [Tabrizicola sp.]
MDASQPQTKTATWIKVLLALSLAVNLAVIGVVAGAVLKNGPRGASGPRDIGIGMLSEALSREDRRALRAEFLARAPDLKDQRQAAKAEFAALLSALRMAPLDPRQLETALTAIEKRNATRLALGRDVLLARLVGMTEADRTAFADRLERGLTRRRSATP